MNEFKQTAEQLGQAAADLQATNEQTTKTVGEVQVELKRVNDKVTELEGIKSRLDAIEKQKGRPGFAGGNGQGSEYKNDFVAGFMRKGDESAIQVKSGNTGVDADGGFAVPEDMDTSITELLGKETPMRSECRVITVGNQGYKKLANLGGAASGWVGETDSRQETGNPKLAQIAPTFGELYANPEATQVMLDDAMFNVEKWFNQEVVIEFSEQENSAFTSGDGSGKPKGILAHTMAATGDDDRALSAF